MGKSWDCWERVKADLQSPSETKARKPTTMVMIPSMMKIQRQPAAYIPSPTDIRDRTYAMIGPNPEAMSAAI
jgi:hypothetical protein